MKINISIPDAFQELFKPMRYKVFYGGRGGAKSHAVARALLVLGMTRPLRIVCAREFQKSIKDSVHKLLGDLILSHELLGFYEILEKSIRAKNGTEFIFVGLKHNVEGIKSLEGADIVWVEEAANVSEKSWEILIPTIRKDGSEIWVTYNPVHATDPTHDKFVINTPSNAFVKKVSWRDNPWFNQVLRDELEDLKQKDYETYLHIWEGSPDTRKTGFIYAKELDKARADERVCKVPYDPVSPVFTAWDIGLDGTALWFMQFVGRELRWIDCYESVGQQLLHNVDIMRSKPYRYADTAVFLPHDGGHDNVRGDSVEKQIRSFGYGVHVFKNDESLIFGIDQTKKIIESSVFDQENCKDGLKALDNYKFMWDENRNCFSNTKPKHDWASHYADSARYAARAATNFRNLTEKTEYKPLNISFV